MNIFTSLLRGIGLQKAAPAKVSGAWTVVGGESGGISTASLLDANKEWVFIAVDKIAAAVASIRFKVMRYKSSGDDQEVFEGPLVEFLEAPAKNFTGKDFIYLNTVYKELAGNAFWEKIQKGKVSPLIPSKVTPIFSNGALIGYKYADGAAVRTIVDKDVLHDRYVDPAKPHWGKGKLERIARWVDTSSFVAEFLSRFFVNGATFGGFIETEEETQERINLIKAGLKNDHVGVGNAHKIGVLPKGSKFNKVTANMAEMEMGETDDRYRDKILAGFGVPKTLVGLTTEVNRASAEASEYIFAKYTVKPIADDFVEFLNNNVAPMFDTSGKYYFAYEDFVPVNMELKLKEREVALAKQPYMTVNEVRASVGLPKIEGGDVVYANPAFLPLGEQPEPEDDGEDVEKPDKDEPKKFIPPRARAMAKRDRLFDAIAGKAAEVIAAHQDTDAISHRQFAGRVDAHQNLIADKVRDFNNRQERDVTQRLKFIVKGVAKGDIFDMDGEVSVLVDFVTPMLKGLMLEQAAEEFLQEGFPGTFDQSEPRINKVIERAAKRLARSYNSTTASLIQNALNDGVAGGEDLAQLAARVKQVYEFSNQVRALAVARTEAFYIANEGSREAFIQSGVVQTMRWYTSESEQVCEFCAPQHGKVIGVSEVFYPKGHVLEGKDGGTLALDYRAIDVPPLHTNCACFVRPERIEIG